ncbi:MAG: ATP-binding protein [Bacteroidetes bacterium]|nr:ATP-binding protein [Bacteroidota bacterium]
MIYRTIEKLVADKLFKGKAILVIGARQTGKTTLLNKIYSQNQDKSKFFNCDNPDTREKFTNPTSTQLQHLIGSSEIILIDEAQRIENIGLTLKIIIDTFKKVQVIVSGSSSLEIANKINESLTGRKWEYLMFPLSFEEMVNHSSLTDEIRLIEHRMVYGYYPDVVTMSGHETEILKNLSGSYLYKDIFLFKEIRRPELLEKLLVALALQLGSEVSFHELSQMLGVDTVTVEKYITYLEQAYVIFRLKSFNRNLRNELKKSRKIYFYDNGIRNTIISNFNSLSLRSDTGALWENFLVSGRLKFLSNNLIYSNNYFWRTMRQQEIDYIEDRNGKLFAFELKWNANKKYKIPESFMRAYPGSEFKMINPENYHGFLTGI